MRARVKAINNAITINDWVQIQQEFEKLQKLLTKAAQMIQNDGYPRFYVRSLVELSDALAAASSVSKKMNKSTNKAYSIILQKLKKICKVHEVEIANFKENPINEEDSADEAEELAFKQEMEKEDAADTKKVAFEQDNDEGFEVVGKKSSQKSVTKITSAALFSKYEDILQARGKKNTDKASQIESILALLNEAFTPYQKIKCLMSLISSRFDYSSTSSSIEMWKAAQNEINQLHDLLDANPHITIRDVAIDETVPLHTTDKEASEGKAVVIRGTITSFVDRLDDEFYKSLLSIDSHTTDYVDRLKDGNMLYALIVRTQKYAELVGVPKDALDLLIMRRVEHLYYKVFLNLTLLARFRNSNN